MPAIMLRKYSCLHGIYSCEYLYSVIILMCFSCQFFFLSPAEAGVFYGHNNTRDMQHKIQMIKDISIQHAGDDPLDPGDLLRSISEKQSIAAKAINENTHINNIENNNKLAKFHHGSDINKGVRESVVFPIRYQSAEVVANMLHKTPNLISKNANIIVDKVNNRLLLLDLKSHMEQLKKFLSLVDVPPRQVRIKAKIMDIDRQSLRDLGIDFFMQQTTSPVDEGGYGFSLPKATAAVGELQFPVLQLSTANQFDVKITALERTGRVTLIAAPQLMTLNRHLASIQSGEDIPYQQAANNGATSIAFKKASLLLQVRPIILPHHKIRLQLVVNNDQVSEAAVNGSPIIRTRQLKTEVVMRQHQTLVLGGIYKKSDTVRRTAIPFLSRIPILGWMFRHNSRSLNRQQLLIFISPSIVS